MRRPVLAALCAAAVTSTALIATTVFPAGSAQVPRAGLGPVRGVGSGTKDGSAAASLSARARVPTSDPR